MSKPTALLVVNPAAGQGMFIRDSRPTWRLLRIIDTLGRRYELEWNTTNGPGDATERAREAAEHGYGAVFALGGDGTLREAAAGLLGTSVPLGLLAGGTTNVLAPSLGIPRNAMEAAESYAPEGDDNKATVRAVDVGLCSGHPFLMMMSRGLDGRALLNTSKPLKRRLGRTAVGLSVAREFLRRPEQLFQTVTEEGLADTTPRTSSERRTISSSFLGVCNVPHYAGGFVLAPDASPFDGQLDLVALTSQGRWATARFAANITRGTLRARRGQPQPLPPDVLRQRVRRIEIAGEGEALVQIDGDPIVLELPIQVALAQARLLLLWPRGR